MREREREREREHLQVFQRNKIPAIHLHNFVNLKNNVASITLTAFTCCVSNRLFIYFSFGNVIYI